MIKNNRHIIVFLLIFLIFLLKGFSGVFNGNLYVYSPAELHAFDVSLFPNNIDVVLNEGSLSPRFVAIGIINALMAIGFSYESSYLILYIITSLLTATAVYLFLKRIDSQDNLFMVVLVSVLLAFSTIGDFARFQTFTPESLFLGLGLSLATIGVVHALTAKNRRDCNLAYFFVILAACAHIHEGIWGFAIVSFLILIRQGVELFKYFGVYLAASGILLLTVPVLLTTQEAGLSPQEFYDIYVRFRAPHHLFFGASATMIPSTIVSYILICLIVREQDKSSLEYKVCLGLLFAFLLTLVVWYVTYEVLHSSFFIKLYIPKFIKYLNVVYTLLLCKSLLSWKDKSNALYVFLISSAIAINFFIIPIYMVPALAIYYFLLKVKMPESYRTVVLLVLTILFILSGARYTYFLGAILGLGLFLLRYFSNKPFVLSSFLVIVLAVLVIKPVVSNKDLRLADALLANQCGRSTYDFSKDLSEVVPKDESILIDSKLNQSGYVQHISRRDVYALVKAAPSNENGIGEWYGRLQEVKKIEQWDASQFSSFMQRKKLNYVVIKKDQYNDSFDDLFEKIITSDELILLKKNKI